VKSPYHGNSHQHHAWVRGFTDHRSGAPFNSGDPNQLAVETLAYNEGWRYSQALTAGSDFVDVEFAFEQERQAEVTESEARLLDGNR
jgi:hypothetical protein